MTDNVHSPMMQPIEAAFDSYRDLGYSDMLVFLGKDGFITCEGVLPGLDPSAVAEHCQRERPEEAARLVMALDLEQPFAEQYAASSSAMAPHTARALFGQAAHGMPVCTFGPGIPASPPAANDRSLTPA